jgi:hypothetical protein
MTAVSPGRAAAARDWGRVGEKTAPWRSRLAVGVLVGGLLAILVGHGCHGPDEDHEPTVAPPAERDRP